MATHAIIVIEGATFANIYKHYDGDLRGTFKWLTEFNESFTEKRNDDPYFKFAQLLRASASLDKDPIHGWGVIPPDESMREQFKYVLHLDGSTSFEEIHSNAHNSFL